MSTINAITIENFRCFREKQEARLTPLTLLVGENSTGKTSFLALLRTMDYLTRGYVPDFKWPPYDLGSFDEIAHYRGSRGGREEIFSAEVSFLSASTNSQDELKLTVQFEKDKEGTAPVPLYQRVSLTKPDEEGNDYRWIEINFESSSVKLALDTKQVTYNPPQGRTLQPSKDSFPKILTELFHTSRVHSESKHKEDSLNWIKENLGFFLNEISAIRQLPPVFASAPVRSEPRRTYNPARPAFDPEGDYIPMILAQLSSHKPELWESLKKRLEKFGQNSGLFDEIRIRRLGKSSSDPFQVQVRKSGQKRKGVWRNLKDVGYGVSQALPIITELLLEGTADPQTSGNSPPRQFLLQQPEVHLHPSAQAALGSLFCQVAGPNCQLVVETHSDNLIDRVRMDVRDGVSNLKPEDVSILFFERRELDVQIHSLRFDKEGNVRDAPKSYRQFFMEEVSRSLWPPEPEAEA